MLRAAEAGWQPAGRPLPVGDGGLAAQREVVASDSGSRGSAAGGGGGRSLPRVSSESLGRDGPAMEGGAGVGDAAWTYGLRVP